MVNIDDQEVNDLLESMKSNKSRSIPKEPGVQRQQSVKQQVKKLELVKLEAKELVSMYRSRHLQLENINEIKRIYEIKTKDKINELTHDGYVMQREIQSSIDDQKIRVEKQFKQEIEVINIREKNIANDAFQVDKIIYFLERKEKIESMPELDFSSISCNKGHFELFDKYQDELMTLVFCVSKNDKPVNCYDLNVIGRCPLGAEHYSDRSIARDVLELPKSYGLTINYDWHVGINLSTVIGSYPSIEDAKEHAKRLGFKGVLREFFNNYDIIKQEYFFTIQNYVLSDFDEIKEKNKDE